MKRYSEFLNEAYYIGVVPHHGSIRAKRFAQLKGSTSHLDEFPHESRLPSQCFRFDGKTGTLAFNETPTQEDYFRVLDFLDRERQTVKWIDDTWGTKIRYQHFDPRTLPESYTPKKK